MTDTITSDEAVNMMRYTELNRKLYELNNDEPQRDLWAAVKDRIFYVIVEQKRIESNDAQAEALRAQLHELCDGLAEAIANVREAYVSALPEDLLYDADAQIFMAALDHYKIDVDRIQQIFNYFNIGLQRADEERRLDG